MIYPELFRNTGSSLPDRRATPRQKYGTGWVLNLARKIDISSTPLLIFPGWGSRKVRKFGLGRFFCPSRLRSTLISKRSNTSCEL